MADKTALTEAYWREFLAHGGLAGSEPGDPDYAVCRFGDNDLDAAELAGWVIDGRKRATASLARDYADAPDSLPKVGDYVVVVDADHRPCCIWRSREIEIKPMIEVDARFAWDEGEGDRSLDYWLRAHREYFSDQAVREGFAMHDGIGVVFERFAIVWPLALADREPDQAKPL